MKLLVVGDLHAHPHFKDWRKVDDAITVIEWVFSLAVDFGVSAVIFLGDIFHTRRYIYPSILARLYDSFSMFKDVGIPLIFVVGNHDMVYKHSTRNNSLVAFRDFGFLIEEPTIHEFKGGLTLSFLPYISNPETARKAIDYLPSDSILFTHLDISGGFMNNHLISDQGVNTEDLSKFKLVLSGHYHKYHGFENIIYVGSAWQIDFSEESQKKVVLLWDDGDLKEIVNGFSPIHKTITKVDQIDGYSREMYVRMRIGIKDDIEELHEQLQKNRFVRHVNFILEKENGEEESVKGIDVDIVEDMSPHKIIDQYIESIEVDLDKSRLKEIGSKIVDEVQNSKIP